MAERKSPTTTAILRELNGINQRVTALEQWKLSEDAYRAALKQIKQEEESGKFTKLRDGELASRTAIWKQVGIIAGLIILALYAYLATKGVHP